MSLEARESETHILQVKNLAISFQSSLGSRSLVLGMSPLPKDQKRAGRQEQEGGGGEGSDCGLAATPPPELGHRADRPGEDRFSSKEPFQFVTEFARGLISP